MRSFQQWADYLGHKQSRPAGNNTRVENRGDNIAIKLHSTDVVTLYPDGSYTLNTGGWFTSTTKDRINKHGPVRVWSDRGQWKFKSNGHEYLFADGVTISQCGLVTGAAQPSDAAKEKKLRKDISGFAKLCAGKVPLDRPGSGDCFYCQMREVETHKPLGEVTQDTSHLLAHMQEGYAVPSLVERALEVNGSAELIIVSAFKGGKMEGWTELSKSHVRRAVGKYLLRQFALG